MDKDIKIAALQETKLNKESRIPTIPKYNLVRKDRPRNSGGGVAFLVHEDIIFEKLADKKVDFHIETLAIKIGDIKIVNIYIPPASSCAAGFIPEITPLLPTGDAIIAGDINAHDPLWNSTIVDTRGSSIAEEIGASNYGVLNNEQPTRLPPNGQPTSPDITLASLSLLPYTSWETQISLGSDHLPIVISCSTNIKPLISENKTFVNFKKADWPKFSETTESEFSKLQTPTDVYKAEKCFRKIINQASKRCIPQGRIKEIIPEIPAEAVTKMKTRDEIRKDNPSSLQIGELNIEIDTVIREYKRSKWREKVESIGRKTDSGKLYKLIKGLNGQPAPKDNQGIHFKGKILSIASKIADGFNKQFSSVKRHISSKQTRKITKASKKNSLSGVVKFTDEQTKDAIKKAKASKAIGPDGISNLHLKHIGPAGISYLTEIFNLSTAKSQIPQIWKKSIIIPLLKPTKEADQSTSYRPVSLLCPAVKILERLVLPTLQERRSYGPCKKLAFILFDNNIETDIDIQNHSLVRIHEI